MQTDLVRITYQPRHVYGKHERPLNTYRQRDFCPLCGARFFGDTNKSLMQDILNHIETEYCSKHWVPLSVALKDIGEDLTNLPFVEVNA
jgi:hypothetical protein